MRRVPFVEGVIIAGGRLRTIHRVHERLLVEYRALREIFAHGFSEALVPSAIFDSQSMA